MGMTAGVMVVTAVMTAGMTGVEVADTTDVMTAGDMTAVIIMTDEMVVMTAEVTAGAMIAVITMTDVMVGMTVEVTAEATIAEAVVIDMTVGPKTGGHQIVMMVLEKGQNCS